MGKEINIINEDLWEKTSGNVLLKLEKITCCIPKGRVLMVYVCERTSSQGKKKQKWKMMLKGISMDIEFPEKKNAIENCKGNT